MPVVPYGAPQVEAKPLPAVRQEGGSASLFTAGAVQQQEMGKALMSTGGVLDSISVKMAERENADMLFRAETAIKTEYLGFETAARERRGDAAKNLTKDTAKWWEEKASEHAGNLGNQRQKQLFGQQVAQLRLQSIHGMSHYESEQRRIALNESNSASIVSSINLAASQVGTPVEMAAINGAKLDILKRLDVTRQVNGWSPEMHEAKEKEALTNLHMQVIQNMVNSNPSRAKAYFEANKGEINGAEYEKIEGLYKTGAAKEKAQKTAAELTTAGSTEESGLTYIRQHLKGEEQEAAALEWKTRWQEQATARERTQKTAADEAYKIYARTGRLSDVPASLIQQMDGKVWLALQKDAREAAEGKLPKTDWDKYYTLRQQAFDNPAAFARRDLRGDFTYLGKAERESMIDLQTKLNKPEEMKDVATLENQLSNTHDLLGWGASDREKKGKFDTVVQQTITTEEKVKGKKLTFEERQKVIDRMVIEGKVEGSGIIFNDSGRYYEFSGREDKGKFTPKVPKDERAKIEAALKRAGKKADDATILQLYKRKMGLPGQSSEGRVAAPRFQPESAGYDYDTARAAGMGPDGKGENAGHWGSVAPVSGTEKKRYGLPDEAYVILKGRSHETFDKAVKGEEERGFKVIKRGDRYYSVPKSWKDR